MLITQEGSMAITKMSLNSLEVKFLENTRTYALLAITVDKETYVLGAWNSLELVNKELRDIAIWKSGSYDGIYEVSESDIDYSEY